MKQLPTENNGRWLWNLNGQWIISLEVKISRTRLKVLEAVPSGKIMDEQ